MPIKDQTVLERYLAALRKAGLSEHKHRVTKDQLYSYHSVKVLTKG
ncbi:MAG TPA: hypothetical protein VGX03_12540 [Candidatus Binatia bacterium]|jgi:hypothetical protein|nr:hypothetical protein [Candidatus Binatia bacterium]